MRTWPALRLSGVAAPAPEPGTSTADLLHAVLSDHPVAAIEEISPDEWQVFFTTDDERGSAAAAVAGHFPTLTIALTDVADEDWAAKSQASLRAIRIGAIVVAPTWDVQPPGEALQIIIQPSMGFGTGHHATTRLCLSALQAIHLTGRRVIDVGTGSGVLAIAASLLGAATVTAIDDDRDAIQSAIENLSLNVKAAATFTVVDLRGFDAGNFDVVTANLTGGLLVATAGRIENLTRPGGTLILSGLMASEAEDVILHFSGSTVTSRADEDEWVCLTLERRIAS